MSELEKLAADVRSLASQSSALRAALTRHCLASRDLVSRAQSVGADGAQVAQSISAAGGDAAKALHSLTEFAASAERFAERLAGGGRSTAAGGEVFPRSDSVFAAATTWDEAEDVMIGDRRVVRSEKSSTHTETVDDKSRAVCTNVVTVGANTAIWNSVDGRPASAKGVIREVFSGASRPSGESAATRRAGGAHATDDGGHLIGFQFLLAQGMKNLLPQDAHLNRGSYKSMETAMAGWAKTGHAVHFAVTPEGADPTGRPAGFTVYLMPHLGGSPVAHPSSPTGRTGVRVDPFRVTFSNPSPRP